MAMTDRVYDTPEKQAYFDTGDKLMKQIAEMVDDIDAGRNYNHPDEAFIAFDAARTALYDSIPALCGKA